MSAPLARWPVVQAVAGAGWSDQPGRLALAVLGIALGVALGVAVYLINASAAGEFERAVRSLSGEADALVRGSQSGFPDAVYARVAALSGVQAASPAVELQAQLAGRRDTIKVLGLDAFRAAEVQPHLLADARDSLLELLKGQSVLLSRAAADELELRAGDALRLHSGSGLLELKVLEVLPQASTQQRVAIMDIAGAQWHFGRVGALQRIDVKLAPGTTFRQFEEQVAPLLPAGTLILTPDAEAERSTSLTRAYRVNLDMLALIALLTGAFLVFSTQFLALLRRRTQLALLRVLGLTRGEVLRLLLSEAAVLGAVGSAAGLALGWVLADVTLARLGADLGAGYFSAVTAELTASGWALAGYFVLGTSFAVLGAAVPAFEASARPPALALRAGDEEAALSRVRTAVPAVLLIALALLLTQLPAIGGVPVFGYMSIGLLLLGTIGAMPCVSETLLPRLPVLRYPPAALAAAQLQATPRQTAVSLAAIVVSFSLMVSMVIMTGSFRTSLEHWLDRMLPADVYVRAGRMGDTGYFTRDEQARIAALAGIEQAVFGRTQNVQMRRDRPPMTLLARPVVDGRPVPPLPLQGREAPRAPQTAPPAWVSEVAAELLALGPGDPLALPIGGATRTFVVAGIWRDYARQNGAIVIDHALYVAATGDERVNEAALHLAAGVPFDDVAARVRALFADPQAIEIASTRDIKTASLSIFDRTFAITYALEIAAVFIGLFGVSASFGAQALARRREFGVLRHIGMTRREIAAMLAAEGLLVGLLGVAVGLAVGWVVSLILIHVVNRQSFHWSMDMHLPWLPLALLAGVLAAAAALTAVVSGRRAMSDEMTRAVREDW